MLVTLERWRVVRAAAARWVVTAAGRLGLPLTSPACPACKTRMTDAVDLLLRVPWHSCRCGFAGTMIHALARGRTLEGTANELGGPFAAASDFSAVESDLGKLSAQWSEMTSAPLVDVPADDWPSGRERLLEAVGLTSSRLVLDALHGLIVPCCRSARPLFHKKLKVSKRRGPIPQPAVHLALYSAPGRLAALMDVTLNCNRLQTKLLCPVLSPDPLWAGRVDHPDCEIVGDLGEFLGRFARGEPVGYSPSPHELAGRMDLPLADTPIGWIDSRGRPLRRKSHRPPPLPGVPVQSAVIAGEGRLLVVKNDALESVTGETVWPIAYRVGLVADANGERWLRVTSGSTSEWVAEDEFRDWLKARVPKDRWKKLIPELVAAAYSLCQPAAVRSERSFGWDHPCRGFGVPGGLITGGVFQPQPWRGRVPAAGYPGRAVVELSGLTPIEKLVAGGLARRWAETVSGRPLTETEEAETLARPDRTRRLVGFLLWLTASAERTARAERGDCTLHTEWVRSEYDLIHSDRRQPVTSWNSPTSSSPSPTLVSDHG